MPVRLRSSSCRILAVALAAQCVAAAMLAGCARRSKGRPTLRLYCGAGIRSAVAELVEEFQKDRDVKIEPDYAGSNILLSRIKLTRRGDLYMPGDVRYVEQADAENLIESWKTACYFVPVILVRKGNPKGIRKVADLTRPGIRIGLGDAEACAIGKVTEKLLEKNGVDATAIEPNVVFRSLTVNELGVQIQAGKIDATIVWDAIAKEYPDDGQIVAIPPQDNVISTVPVAVLRSSESPELARAFQDFVVSERGAEVFARHGYTTQSPL